MSKQKHTQGEWYIDSCGFITVDAPDNDKGYLCIADADCSFDLELTERTANANFIVNACNNHYGVVEALENWFECSDNHDTMCTCGRDKAKAAITKAKGEGGQNDT